MTCLLPICICYTHNYERYIGKGVDSLNRATALLGAGAAIEIGGPTSSELTKNICSQEETCEALFNQIVGWNNPSHDRQQPNFEDIMNALESLSSYSNGMRFKNSEYNPAELAFIEVKSQKFSEPNSLNLAKSRLINIIAERVNQYNGQFKCSDSNTWFWNFWVKATNSCCWDIGTLNYDDCVDQSIHNFNDGYRYTDSEYSTFDPFQMTQLDNTTRIMHLHGSIFYGYRQDDKNDNYLENFFEDLYKFNSLKKSCDTWNNRSPNISQSGMQAIIGPIITGRRKSDKLLAYPYSYYYNVFQQSLLNNSSLLIVGYSFGDLHINSLLWRFKKTHGSNRRIVLIADFPKSPCCWNKDPLKMKWPTPDMYRFIANFFGQTDPFTSSIFQNPVKSLDGCVMLYVKGFKDAVENSENEILNFLTR